ncbi:SDR family oxidoreductase [Massilia arenae]|uniref:SDR family oxidoreductase n=1 Tax=Massilia arenae TaxID=2603288 RepID=A0A5C7G8E5_9BURK|nr:SDR family oxidoreductase [Massilia arenae]TXG02328.1 SDR family oxidoreductase [Massilia arenae]
MQRTWFITGTSTGFGRIMTEQLLARGDRVAAALRNPPVLAELQERHPGQLWVAQLDVTDDAAIRSVMARAFAELGRIDVVVSNAAYGLFGAAEELTDLQVKRQLDTNLLGSIQLIRAALPHLRAQGGGRVIQVSSEGGQMAYPNFSVYHATKWGIEGFVESVAQEVAPFGIEFTLAEPGPTPTNFAAGLDAAPAMDEYVDTPSGGVRRALADGSFKLTGDPVRMVEIMIDSAGQVPAPRRITLGSTAYDSIRAALTDRLTRLDAQKSVAQDADLKA